MGKKKRKTPEQNAQTVYDAIRAAASDMKTTLSIGPSRAQYLNDALENLTWDELDDVHVEIQIALESELFDGFIEDYLLGRSTFVGDLLLMRSNLDEIRFHSVALKAVMYEFVRRHQNKLLPPPFPEPGSSRFL